jgi:hypothetical protein
MDNRGGVLHDLTVKPTRGDILKPTRGDILPLRGPAWPRYSSGGLLKAVLRTVRPIAGSLEDECKLNDLA